MGEPLRRLCASFPLLGETGDTLVQYAACLSVFLCEEEPVAQFDSDYSGGEGASIYFFLQVCRLSFHHPLRFDWTRPKYGILLICGCKGQ